MQREAQRVVPARFASRPVSRAAGGGARRGRCGEGLARGKACRRLPRPSRCGEERVSRTSYRQCIFQTEIRYVYVDRQTDRRAGEPGSRAGPVSEIRRTVTGRLAALPMVLRAEPARHKTAPSGGAGAPRGERPGGACPRRCAAQPGPRGSSATAPECQQPSRGRSFPATVPPRRRAPAPPRCIPPPSSTASLQTFVRINYPRPLKRCCFLRQGFLETK